MISYQEKRTDSSLSSRLPGQGMKITFLMALVISP
jgi:hypothetical protein